MANEKPVEDFGMDPSCHQFADYGEARQQGRSHGRQNDEGDQRDGTVLDSTLLVFVHEHAEANIHKASGMIAILAGAKDRLTLGRHTRSFGTFGDLYLTLVDGVLDLGVDAFPTATKKLPGILA